MDLRTGKVQSFMASSDQPTRSSPGSVAVKSIAPDGGGGLWVLANSSLWNYRPASDSWQVLTNHGGQFVYSFFADESRVVEGVAISQIEISLQKKPGSSSAGGESEKTTRVVSEEELDQLRAELKTNGSGLYISGTAVGKYPHVGGLDIKELKDGRSWRFADANLVSKPPTAMLRDGDTLWVGGEGYLAQVDLSAREIRKFSRVRGSS